MQLCKPDPILIDSHAHLEMPEYNGDRNEVIRRAVEKGIGYIVTVGIDVDSCKQALALVDAFDTVYAIVGVHPHNVKHIDGKTYTQLKEFVLHEKVRAVGEIGLDFYRNLSPQDVQLKRFRELIALAREVKLPIVVHDRDAHRETLSILREEKASEIGGVIHCFSGDYTMASKCFDMGFYISIPGTVTFRKAHTLQEVVKRSPLDRMLIETDAPFLAPVPFRGKRNEPSYVRYVAEALAHLKGISLEEVSRITSSNTLSLFRIPS
jgi:TatD DNase family protein